MRGKVFEKGEGTFKYPRKDNNGGVLIMTVYDKNPLEAEFEEEERRGGLSGVLELRKTVDEKVDEAQTKYLGFNVSGKVIYGAESGVKKENLLEWGKYFTVFKEENDNDIVCDSPVENRIRREGWDSLREYELKQEIRKEKRKIVCRHPLDWDKEQYKDSNIRGLMFWGNEERHRLLLEKMEAIEIWGHIKDHGDIREERNNFWYGHPVYFINHLERAGLLRHPRIDELLAVQDEVIRLPCLIKDTGKGIYKYGKKDETYCNHAVFLTIWAVDGNMSNFTGKAAGTFPDPLPGHNYEYRTSNYWCDVLVTQANEGKIAEFTGTVTEKEAAAQEKANEGYVVIGAYRSENKLNSGSSDIHPHFATIQPGFASDPDNGPMLANVGTTNGFKLRLAGFPGISADKIHWYYNPNQDFQYKPEILDQYRGPGYLL